MSSNSAMIAKVIDTAPMTRMEAVIAISTGVVLPTIDIFSDLAFAVRLLTKEDWNCLDNFRQKIPLLRKLRIYGGISFIFPTASFTFATHHWWQLENSDIGGAGRLKTLPFLLMQVWPQYRVMKMVYMGYWKGDPQWRRERDVLAQNVMSVEPFVESVPQVFWITFLWLSTGGCVGPTFGDNFLRAYLGKIDMLGTLTYATSILSASLGLTNFLRVGPLKVIPNQPVAGFGHLSFHLLFWSIAFSLIARGSMLLFFMKWYQIFGNYSTIFSYISPTWALSIFIPQLLLSLGSLMVTAGLKKAFKLTARYPALLLMAVFTPYTFGPVTSKCSRHGQTGQMIRLHHGLTLFNLAISTAVLIVSLGYACSCDHWSLPKTIDQCLLSVIFDLRESIFPLFLPLIHLLTCATTVGLCLTDICSCGCPNNCKPDREARHVNDLLSYSETAREIEMNDLAKVEDTPGHEEEA